MPFASLYHSCNLVYFIFLWPTLGLHLHDFNVTCLGLWWWSCVSSVPCAVNNGPAFCYVCVCVCIVLNARELKPPPPDRSAVCMYWQVIIDFDGQLWTRTIVRSQRWLVIVAAGEMLILVPPQLLTTTTTTKPAPNDINVMSISVEMGGFENQTACY